MNTVDSEYNGDDEEETITFPREKDISRHLDQRSGSEASSKVVSLSHVEDDASSKVHSLMMKDLPLSITEKARNLVSLLDSSMMEPYEQADNRDLKRNYDINRNSSSSLGYDVQLRPESIQQLGSRALDLILDILSTDPYNKAHTAFLRDIMGFTDRSMYILRNKIIESNRVENRTAFILSIIQDLILQEDNCCPSNVKNGKVESIELSPTSQEPNSLEIKNVGTDKEKHKRKSTIKSFFTHWINNNKRKNQKKWEESIASSSSYIVVAKKSLTKTKSRSTDGKKNVGDDNDVVSLGREIALFMYQWIALVAFDAIQFYSNTRLSLLRRDTP
jgi:hypothetical protein